MLYSVLLTIDVLIAIGLIVLVLLQHGRGADAGAAFGSGASATVFGARGSASFLSRTTAILATFFFINSLRLAFLVSHQPAGGGSVVEQIEGGAPPSLGRPKFSKEIPPADVLAPDVLPADVPRAGAKQPTSEQAPAADEPRPADVPG